MPVLFITTNLEKTVVPKDEAILALSKVAAKLSGKPEAVRFWNPLWFHLLFNITVYQRCP